MTGMSQSSAQDAVAAVDALTADARRKAERYQAMQAQAQQVSVRASTPDGMVTVTVDSAGNVSELQITDAAREKSGDEIATAVLGTIRQAQAKLPDRLAEVMAETIGDDQGTIDHIVGTYRAKFPDPTEKDPAEQRAGQPDDEDSEDWVLRSFTGRSGNKR